MRDRTRFAWMIGCQLALITFAAVAQVLAGAPPAPVPPRPDVMLVQHAYDGPIETAGRVGDWRYVPLGTEGETAMRLDWVDTTTDGIYRGGFEARADVRGAGEGG
jgi:hypothetical protein